MHGDDEAVLRGERLAARFDDDVTLSELRVGPDLDPRDQGSALLLDAEHLDAVAEVDLRLREIDVAVGRDRHLEAARHETDARLDEVDGRVARRSLGGRAGGAVRPGFAFRAGSAGGAAGGGDERGNCK